MTGKKYSDRKQYDCRLEHVVSSFNFSTFFSLSYRMVGKGIILTLNLGQESNKSIRSMKLWLLVYCTLAWEPSFAWKLNLLYTSKFLNLDSNQAKNIPMVLSSVSIIIWGKSVKGFLCYDQDILYIYRY